LRIAAATFVVLGLGATGAVADPPKDQTDLARPIPAGKIRVGIVPGIAVNVDTAKADGLAQDLSEALAQELDIETVGGLEVRRRLPEQLPADCVTSPSCIADIAARLNVNQMLFVVFVDGATLQVDSTWVDVRTGRSASRPPIDVVSGAEARAKFTASATQLLPDAPIRKKDPTTIYKQTQLGKMTPDIPRHFTRTAYITSGIALVGVGIGIGFGLKARSHYNDCEASVACSTGTKDGIRHLDLAADAGYLAAVAAAIATGILFGTSGSESHLVVAPAEGGATVGAFGRF
jgi:hypothetical protein